MDLLCLLTASYNNFISFIQKEIAKFDNINVPQFDINSEALWSMPVDQCTKAVS